MNKIKSLIKNIFCFVGRHYYHLRSKRSMWLFINRKGRSLFGKSVPKLSEVQQRIVSDLRKYGIAKAHINELFGSEVFEELKAYIDRRWQEPEVRKQVEQRLKKNPSEHARAKSYFLINLWEGDNVLDLSHPFLRYSLSEEILAIASHYLQMYPKFRYWHLETTMPMPAGEKAIASQMWHRDPDDQQMMKTFIYFNDVDEEAGPFTYLKYSQYGGKNRHLFPQNPPSGTGKMPPNVDELIPQEDRMVATGQAGSIIFADTSGLHRGGFAKSKNRFMYTSAYETEASYLPIRYKFPDDFDTASLSQMQKYTLDNNPNQKEAKYF